MDNMLSAAGLRAVPELSYLNAANVVRYRAIMRFIYIEYQRLMYWLRPEESYTIDMCLSDLEQLKNWGNLASRHDGGRVGCGAMDGFY
jgi:hypothetical protein